MKTVAFEIGYPVPAVQVSDKMVKRFGKADFRNRIVRLNKRFVELNSGKVVRALIVHELVHLKFPNHEKGFIAEMILLGFGKHIMGRFRVKMEKYRYECKKCGIILDNRKLKVGICKKCGGKVVGKGKEIVRIS